MADISRVRGDVLYFLTGSFIFFILYSQIWGRFANNDIYLYKSEKRIQIVYQKFPFDRDISFEFKMQNTFIKVITLVLFITLIGGFVAYKSGYIHTGENFIQWSPNGSVIKLKKELGGMP